MKAIVSNLFLGFGIVCCVAFLVFVWWAINGCLQSMKKKGPPSE
jgi:hypothetical protein